MYVLGGTVMGDSKMFPCRSGSLLQSHRLPPLAYLGASRDSLSLSSILFPPEKFGAKKKFTEGRPGGTLCCPWC